MPHFHDQRVLAFTPSQLFDLVVDIDAYQTFLPWCKYSKVTGRDGDVIFADLTVSFKGIQAMYGSEVSVTAPNDGKAGEIHAVAVSGPFQELRSSWFFSPDPKGCLVDFTVDFSFKSSLLDTMLRGVFVRAQEKLLNAFVERARALYL